VISVAFKTPLKTRLGTCIYKNVLLNRPDDYIDFTPSCSPHFTTQLHPYLNLTAWCPNSESGSCAVWVSYWQMKLSLQELSQLSCWL